MIFVARENELNQLIDSATSTDKRPFINFIHDSEETREERGGIGKTTLCKKALDVLIGRQQAESPYIVLPRLIDFYNPSNQERAYVLNQIVIMVEEIWPQSKRYSTGFHTASAEYDKHRRQSAPVSVTSSYYLGQINHTFIDFIRRFNEESGKYIICFLDTFERVQDEASLMASVEQQYDTFPMRDLNGMMVFIVAGRYPPNMWVRKWWDDRNPQTIQLLPLTPFSLEAVEDYISHFSSVSLPSDETRMLHFLTMGRPIRLAIAVEQLNNQALTPQSLIGETNPGDFWRKLIWNMCNPTFSRNIGDVITIMAHVYHRFDNRFLLQFFPDVDISLDSLAERPYIRSFYDNQNLVVVLHDEVRRQIVEKVWLVNDPLLEQRRDISEEALLVYERAVSEQPNQEYRRALDAERLYHILVTDYSKGWREFEHLVQRSHRMATRDTEERWSLETYLSIVKDFQRNFEDFPNAFTQASPDWKLYLDSYYTGLMYLSQGLINEARSALQAGIKKQSDFQAKWRIARIYWLQGYVDSLTGEWNAALTQYEQSADLSYLSGDLSGVASTYLHMAQACILRDELNRAARYARRSLYTYKNIENDLAKYGETIINVELRLVDVYTVLGAIWVRQRVTPDAPRAFDKAYELLNHVNTLIQNDPSNSYYEKHIVGRQHMLVLEKSYMFLTTDIRDDVRYLNDLKEATEYFEKEHLYSETSLALTMQARILRDKLHSPEEAARLSKKALEIAIISQNQYRITEAHLTLAWSYIASATLGQKENAAGEEITEALASARHHIEAGEEVAAEHNYEMLRSWFDNIRVRLALLANDEDEIARSLASECERAKADESNPDRIIRALENLHQQIWKLPNGDARTKCAKKIRTHFIREMKRDYWYHEFIDVIDMIINMNK